MKTKAQIVKLRARVTDSLDMVLAGLAGTPFDWSASEHQRRVHELGLLGVRLMTETAIERSGHGLKRGAQPVGKAYFEAPICKWRGVYVFGVQTRAKKARGAEETRA